MNLAQTVNIVDPNSPYIYITNLKPSNFFRTGVNLFLGVSGVMAFVYLLWGGIQWIMAGGDKEGLEKARKRITHSLIGLALVFSAYALIYILQVLFNINIIGLNLSPI